MRYSSATKFSRLADNTALKDRVPQGLFKHLNHINSWANGCNNLQEPFYVPCKDDLFKDLADERKKSKKRKGCQIN